MTTTEAAQTLLARRKARAELHWWNVLIGNQPAKHHQLINAKLQEITESPTPRYVILLMPPGAAKSTYASVAFPAWYLGRRQGCSILACSYSYTLAEQFGRRARNLALQHENALGYKLAGDSQAAGEWETSMRGRYFCAGVGSGIAGHRADMGLIDDYIGTQEDADSKTIRDKQWDWFWNDFYPRLKPNASIVIIANRRHEDDLVGRLTDPKREDSPILHSQWEVIRLPFFAEDNDPLGRTKGERLWPEWFTPQQAAQINRLAPRVKAGLYQQRPQAEDGDFFKKDWFVPYSSEEELPKYLRYYAASDHAISKKDDANKSVFGCFGVDSQGDVWWLPDLIWDRLDAEEQCNAMLRLNKKYKFLNWYAEKGHITQSIGPFLRKLMREQKNYINIVEYVPKKDKPTRARSFQGLAALGRIHVPTFAGWWPDALAQLLAFPASTEDDVVDMLAHMGRAVDGLVASEVPSVVDERTDATPHLTYGLLKSQVRRQHNRELATLNN
jgi:predicted phage terminase large subunit-like protein